MAKLYTHFLFPRYRQIIAVRHDSSLKQAAVGCSPAPPLTHTHDANAIETTRRCTTGAVDETPLNDPIK
jgi:hypothetical protein